MDDVVLDMEDVLERVQDDRELLAELLEIFQADYIQKRQQMDRYVQDKDYQQLRDVAHSLKGASGNISARQIFSSCLTIEKMAEEENLVNIETVLAALDQQFVNLQNYIKGLE